MTIKILPLAAVLVLAAMPAAFADGGSAPEISPPANNVGEGPAMPNIRLPDDWANPNTGGEGGWVNNGVPVGDDHVIEGVPVDQ